jgi:spore germination cell wall hydrolase CwlJ-like protein
MGRQSGVGWAVGVIAPWCLGVGMLVSFTADAGQETGDDLYMAPLTARTLATRSGSSVVGNPLTGDIGLYGQNAPRIDQASLYVGESDDLQSIPDESEPRVDLKPNVAYFPEVDRRKKGDPVVPIRPAFDTRLKSRNVARPDLAFRIGESAIGFVLAPRAALPGDEPLPDAGDSVAEEETQATTQRGNAIASPAQSGSAPTARASEPSQEYRVAHGATPSVSRAAALGSSTPAQPDAVPIEVAAFPQATIAIESGGKDAGDKTPKRSDRPDYAALIDQGKMSRERRCLAEAVYFEARSEPQVGQAAVAQVVLNRVSSGLYPSSVCGVVYQNRHRYHGCQFSFACEGKSLRITESESWATAVRIANEVMDGHTYLSDVGRSTHYHANYVRPRWARHLKRMERIGHHIFYRLKPGQT